MFLRISFIFEDAQGATSTLPNVFYVPQIVNRSTLMCSLIFRVKSSLTSAPRAATSYSDFLCALFMRSRVLIPLV